MRLHRGCFEKFPPESLNPKPRKEYWHMRVLGMETPRNNWEAQGLGL